MAKGTQMTDLVPIFACRGPVLPPGLTAVIISVLLGWLASVVLAAVNPCLIFCLDVTKRSKAAHLLFWAVYVGAGSAVWLQGLAGVESPAWLIPIFGVPILAISHLFVLLWKSRKAGSMKGTTNDT